MKNNNLTPRHDTVRMEIESYRKHLLKLGNELGLTHKETIKKSEALDELINQYIKKQNKEKHIIDR